MKMIFNPTYITANLDIHSLICDMPGFVIIKDLNSNYLHANLNTINEFNLKNSDHLFGYSDLTIPHPLSQNGQFYRNLDFEVIHTGQPMKGICTFPFQGNIRPYHFHKSILKDLHGNNIATYSHAEECIDPSITQFINRLIIDLPIKYKKLNATNSFILNKEYSGVKLSPLESVCLFYLIRQKTKSEIAKILKSSVTIINLYIENIKLQLNVNTLDDILETAIIKRYLNIVPPGIFNPLLQGKNQSLSVNIQQIKNWKIINNSVKFTNREFDCAKLLINGYKIKKIAAILNLSPRTVETHVNNLKMKLTCRDKLELIIKLREMII